MKKKPLIKFDLKLEKFTADPKFLEHIKISQPDCGYRYSLDPFILTNQINVTGNEKVLDIGCGCGIISLLLAFRSPNLNIIGVEIQKELGHFAKLNVEANKFKDTINIIETDINKLEIEQINGKADFIVSNPPYKKKGSGRLNPDTQKAIARHEITLDVYQLFECANRLLKKNGLLYFIFPSERLPDITFAMHQVQFALHSLRFIHTDPDANATRVVVCAKKGTSGLCCIKPPFYIYYLKDQFSDDYISLFSSISNRS